MIQKQRGAAWQPQGVGGGWADGWYKARSAGDKIQRQAASRRPAGPDVEGKGRGCGGYTGTLGGICKLVAADAVTAGAERPCQLASFARSRAATIKQPQATQHHSSLLGSYCVPAGSQLLVGGGLPAQHLHCIVDLRPLLPQVPAEGGRVQGCGGSWAHVYITFDVSRQGGGKAVRHACGMAHPTARQHAEAVLSHLPALRPHCAPPLESPPGSWFTHLSTTPLKSRSGMWCRL